MKKILPILFAVGVLALLFLGRGGSDNVSAGPNMPGTNTGETPAIIGSQAEYEFGSISMAAGKVSRDFTFTNTTGAPLALTRLITSCMCTNAYLVIGDDVLGPFGMPGHGFVPSFEKTVRENESFTVRVVFDPAAHGPAGIGTIDRIVTLSTNAGSAVMRFTATVTP